MPRNPDKQPALTISSRAGTKQSLVEALLGGEGGASVNELSTATGWQAHTVRAALTGLRKRGFVVSKSKIDGTTRYSGTRA